MLTSLSNSSSLSESSIGVLGSSFSAGNNGISSSDTIPTPGIIFKSSIDGSYNPKFRVIGSLIILCKSSTNYWFSLLLNKWFVGCSSLDKDY